MIQRKVNNKIKIILTLMSKTQINKYKQTKRNEQLNKTVEYNFKE